MQVQKMRSFKVEKIMWLILLDIFMEYTQKYLKEKVEGVGYGYETGQEKISAIIKMLTYLGISKKSVTTISE